MTGIPPCRRVATMHEHLLNDGVFHVQLTSHAIENGQQIPARFTEDGNNVSPPLSWREVPDNTEEFALLMEDPDAPREDPWVHWVAYGIPADRRELTEDIPKQETVADPPLLQGHNSFPKNNVGYRGPAPPRGHGRHRYYFRLFALDRRLDLAPDIDKKTLMNAIDGHVLDESELMGTYVR